MKGFIFEYYKYIRCQTNTISDWELPREEAKKTMLTFGEFDRLKVKEIHEFDRYRDLSDLAKKWIGNRQSLLFYTLNDSLSLSYKEDDDEFGFCLGGNKCDNHMFVALTCFAFLESKRNKCQSYEVLLKQTEKKINDTVRDCIPNEVKWVVLGNIGDFGVSVLWFANQFADVLDYVDEIKEKMHDTFQKVNTIFSLNDQKNYDKKLRNEVYGKAFIFVTLKSFLKEAVPPGIGRNNENIYHITGEYDLMLEKDGNSVLKMFEGNESFDHDSDKYQQRFLQTMTILGRRIEDVPAECASRIVQKKTEEPDSNSLTDCLGAIGEYYETSRGKLKEKFPRNAGLIDTLDSLVCDYRYNVAAATNENWASDFSYIFEKNLRCIRDLVEIETMRYPYKDKKSELLRKLMNNLKQQIFHIAECSSMGYELPKCHLRYTGQEDSIMFCYMNIIKEILNTAYGLDSVNKQTEIIPVITVDATPIIETDLYFDNSCLGKDEDLNFKILSVNLPHVSFFDIPNYMMYLYQEIYQHIVPGNREKRDFYMGVLLTTTLFQELLQEYLGKNIDDDVKAKFCDMVFPFLFQWICERFPRIHDKLVDNAKTNDSRLIAQNYINTLKKYLEMSIVSDEISQGEELNGNQFVYFLNNLRKEAEKSADMQDKAIKACMNCLRPFEAANVSNDFLIIAERCKNKVMQHYKDDFSGYQKASADIAMIELAEMSMEEYFTSYLIRQENLLDDKYGWKLKDHRSESVRLRMIVRYFKKKKNIDWNQFLDNFKYMFIARKLILSKKENIKKDISECEQNVMRWLSNTTDILKKEFDAPDNYDQRVVEAFWEEVGVEKRLENLRYDKPAKVKEYFREYRSTVKEYASKIEGVIEKKIGLNLYKDYLVYQQKVFEENIKLFQHFQKGYNLKQIGINNKKLNDEKKVECSERKWQERDKLIIQGVSKIEFVPINNKKEKEYNVKDIMQLMDAFEGATRSLQKSSRNVFKAESRLWYRGQRFIV